MPATNSLPKPNAAYVHVPFCTHRCGYCNFTVIAGRGDLVPRYLAALERELSWLDTPRPVDSLYVGGGTPTELGGAELTRQMQLVVGWFPPRPGCQFTVEANPADVTPEKIGRLAAFGVNRLSLGAQSFDPQKLQLLERRHRPEEIVRAVEVTQSRIDNVCLDLIFAVPGESARTWRRDLERALDLAPAHISTYGLTLERGTAFWGRHLRGNLQPADEQFERELYLLGIEHLTEAGMEHYEVSNFAFPGRRSRHNEVYWSGGEYYAAGPGAARYVNGRREINHRSTTTYLNRVLAGRSPVAESEQLSEEDRARERLVFGLRMLQGVDSSRFAEMTGYQIPLLLGHPLAKHVKAGLLQWQGTSLQLTRDGLLLSDSIWPDFLRV